MKLINLALVAYLVAGISNLWADSSLNVELSGRGAHMGQTNETKAQERIRIGFVLDANGIVEIVGLMESGNYNTPWATVVSDKPFKDQVPLAFKNIYLRKKIGPATISAGALPSDYEVGGAGTNTTGWTDGVEIKVNSEVGDFRVIAGSLGNYGTGNFFERKFSANFIEIEMSKKFFNALITKAAAQSYNNEVYVKGNLELDIKFLGDRVFKLFANALFDVERTAMNFEVGAEFDVLKTIIGKYEKRLELKTYFVNLDQNIPDRSKMIPLFVAYGPQGVIHLTGKIDKNGVLSWFIRGAAGAEARVDAGLVLKFPQIGGHH